MVYVHKLLERSLTYDIFILQFDRLFCFRIYDDRMIDVCFLALPKRNVLRLQEPYGKDSANIVLCGF